MSHVKTVFKQFIAKIHSCDFLSGQVRDLPFPFNSLLFIWFLSSCSFPPFLCLRFRTFPLPFIVYPNVSLPHVNSTLPFVTLRSLPHFNFPPFRPIFSLPFFYFCLPFALRHFPLERNWITASRATLPLLLHFSFPYLSFLQFSFISPYLHSLTFPNLTLSPPHHNVPLTKHHLCSPESWLLQRYISQSHSTTGRKKCALERKLPTTQKSHWKMCLHGH